VIVTRSLIDRLEASSAHASSLLAEAMAATSPSSGAGFLPFGRGALVACGVGRYVNRAIGVSIDEVRPSDLMSIEEWYRDCQLRPMIEVSAWAPSVTVETLAHHGYGPVWFRAMFVRPVEVDDLEPVPRVSVVDVETESDAAQWQHTFSAGFEVIDPDAVAVSDEHTRASRAIEPSWHFVATVDGVVAGCCSSTIVGGLAWLGGTATLPQFRRSGVQTAMVHHRLAHARANGCDLAAATAVPDGASARNLARLGFQLVQHQIVLQAPD
jgi:GNAT superfamily N-acetyltransferase